MILKTGDDLDLEKIAESGQCFRWRKLEDGAYMIPSRDRCLIIKKTGEETAEGVAEYELDCTRDEYDSIWSDYLDMGLEYSHIRALVDKKKDPFLYEACRQQQGIRILKQDLWETLISFIISQNRNIPAIKRSIELLCEMCGKTQKSSRGDEFFTFPEPEDVAKLSMEKLDACRLGYRSRYIHDTACGVVEKTISADKADFDGLTDEECMEKLMSITGVGKKVASCVLLFGLHRIDAFPVDVWIKRILENEYKNGYPMEDHRPYNGIYQQYMFAYYRSISV